MSKYLTFNDRTWMVATLAICAVVLGACNSQNYAKPVETAQYGQKVTYNNQVDVLFVVDTSGSMSQHQKSLASKMGIVVDAFNKTGLDYQFAVTTMDMSSNGAKGRFIYQVGTTAVLNAHTPELVAKLADRLFIGDDDWHPLTRGLESLKSALTAPNASSSGVNAGFLRPNALLNVIFLSTADDRSTSDDYKGWLDKLRPPLPYGGKSWVAQFIGVTPDDVNCKSAAWQYFQPGYAYITLAKYSGGSVETICDGNWDRVVTNVKSRILEMMTEYPLPANVLQSSIKVKVNGLTVPENADNGWTYFAENHSVRFHGTAVPPVDATIDVQYDLNGLK